ncbi:MAG TPA: MOSC domain-containing protein [bacterium]|nr:MOSC domain-containing protein [bacterium]HPS30305.1 MOSC domain-containing protein [bacterium]
MIKIEGINISKEKGTQKIPVESAVVTMTGIEGDAHAGQWHRQISLLGFESIRKFESKAGFLIDPGAFAENIILSGLDFSKVKIGDRLKLGNVIIEITQIGKECHNHACSISKRVGECLMPKEGVFARVIEPGNIHKDQPVEWISVKV